MAAAVERVGEAAAGHFLYAAYKEPSAVRLRRHQPAGACPRQYSQYHLVPSRQVSCPVCVLTWISTLPC